MISSSIYTNEDLGKYPEGIQKALEYLMSRDLHRWNQAHMPLTERIYMRW